MIRTRLTMLGGVLALALALAACSNGGTSDTGGQAAGGQSSGQNAGASEGASGSGTVSVTSGDLGQMLVDSQGRTLYVFLADKGSKSTCYSECADNWPALTASGQPTAGSGVEGSMLGTTARTDGTQQVTLDGHPLYLFAGDSAEGDTNGQGIGNVWYVAAPDGTPIKGDAGGGNGGRY
jgi:predicted lipoprotein with Yx(FWY)xxD motif